MTKDEALKLALEALYFLPAFSPAQNELQDAAIEAIKEALAQPEQEPVAMVESVATVVSESGNQEVTMSWWHEPALPVGTKLYTTPPQRTWVGLTVEDVHDCLKGLPTQSIEVYARSVEAKLKQKNGYAEEKNT